MLEKPSRGKAILTEGQKERIRITAVELILRIAQKDRRAATAVRRKLGAFYEEAPHPLADRGIAAEQRQERINSNDKQM